MIATSDDWGVTKPDPGFFQKMIEVSPCGPGGTLYVGDRLDNDIVPAGPAAVVFTLTEAWQRAATARVEIACTGGHGRTGTAIACLAILDGVPAATAVAFVREHYDQHAVETPSQRRYVAGWPNRAMTIG
jgi:hypothetical protein